MGRSFRRVGRGKIWSKYIVLKKPKLWSQWGIDWCWQPAFHLGPGWHPGLGCCLEPCPGPRSYNSMGLCWCPWLLIPLKAMLWQGFGLPAGSMLVSEGHSCLSGLCCHLGPWQHPSAGCYWSSGPTTAGFCVDVQGLCLDSEPPTCGLAVIWGLCCCWNHASLCGLHCHMGSWCCLGLGCCHRPCLGLWPSISKGLGSCLFFLLPSGLCRCWGLEIHLSRNIGN